MSISPIEITPFQDHHQSDVDFLMTSIAEEFNDNIFSSGVEGNKKIKRIPLDKYWVACSNSKVIGTIGFYFLKNNNVVLKKLFLRKDFRGQAVSKALLDTLITSALEHKTSNIFLGTMTQFKAAQRFYEKNSFVKIPETDLPSDYPANPVDSIFYKRQFNSNL
jgi:N-acetylglutamate synthase-like GNAT family acetyltransferase